MTVYFDHASTGLPRLEEAVEAAVEATGWASPGRGQHGAQARAAAAIEAARRAVGALCGPGTVCFTAGTTAALNQAIGGWRPAPRAIGVTPLAHNAVSRPIRALGVPVWTLPADRSGRVDVGALARAWRDEIDLLVLEHGSNVTGVVQPVGEIAELARRRGARLVVDAAQTAGLDVPLGLGAVDAVAFSAHKALCGLRGVGALVVADGVELEPLVRGGIGFDSAADDVPDELPARLESGTPNVEGIAAFGAAAAHRAAHPWDWRATATALRETVRAAGCSVAEGTLPVVSVTGLGVPPLEAEEILDRVFGIVSRAGLHCAPATHGFMGTEREGTLRLSAGPSTAAEDLAALGEALRALGG